MVLASFDDWSTVSDVVSNFATVAALLVGGAWAYIAFVRERTRWPRAEVALSFSERRLDGEFVLVNVGVQIKNEGRGLMQLTRIRVDLRRVLPLDDDMPAKIRAGDQYGDNGVQTQWPEIKKHERIPSGRIELEPGEAAEFGFDFFIDPTTEVVQAYAFVQNVAKEHGKHPLGWGVTALHDIQATPRDREAL
jgi:hypothetical protein